MSAVMTFYRFVALNELESLRSALLERAEALSLKGTIAFIDAGPQSLPPFLLVAGLIGLFKSELKLWPRVSWFFVALFSLSTLLDLTGLRVLRIGKSKGELAQKRAKGVVEAHLARPAHAAQHALGPDLEGDGAGDDVVGESRISLPRNIRREIAQHVLEDERAHVVHELAHRFGTGKDALLPHASAVALQSDGTQGCRQGNDAERGEAEAGEAVVAQQCVQEEATHKQPQAHQTTFSQPHQIYYHHSYY